MKKSYEYLKIVEWSEEDQCYICSALGWLVYVVIATMDRIHIISFAKLLMIGLKYIK